MGDKKTAEHDAPPQVIRWALALVGVDAFEAHLRVFIPLDLLGHDRVGVFDQDQLLTLAQAHQLIGIGQFALCCRPIVGIGGGVAARATTAARAGTKGRGDGGAEVPHRCHTAHGREILSRSLIRRPEIRHRAGVTDEAFIIFTIDLA
jgi:hypothetical protein